MIRNPSETIKLRQYHVGAGSFDVNLLFSDGTEYYRKYSKTDRGWDVRLRLRAPSEGVFGVSVITESGEGFAMHRFETAGKLAYFETVIHYPECGRKYCFKITGTGSGEDSGQTVWYLKDGVSYYPEGDRFFVILPELSVPEWAKGAVIYQIFTDRFFNGDPSNDVTEGEYYYLGTCAHKVSDWDSYPASDDTQRFYGGDIKGIWDKLDYLQDLGVEVLYLNPIFVSPSNHKYDAQDYAYVDPHYGVIVKDGGEPLPEGCSDNSQASRYITRVACAENLEAGNRFFADFVSDVHRRGMRIILDGVFNHCGSFNKWLDREKIYHGKEGYEPGAFVSAESPYRNYFNFTSENWPDNTDYEKWWGVATLPKLNYEASEELFNIVMETGRKWVSAPYGIDGWRLDVARDVGHSEEYNHYFWRSFRNAVKSANPDTVLIAEEYEDPSAWLNGDQWDTIMNYRAFMEPVGWYLTGIEKHSDYSRPDLKNNYEEFASAMKREMAAFHHESLFCSMNELSNHDHSRFLTRTNGKTGRTREMGPEAANEGVSEAVMREAVLIQMTWPGSPAVYYGDEAGVCGWTDPDDRRTYPWGHENLNLLEFHKAAIALHREHSALRAGSFKMLGGEGGVMAYCRFNREESVIVAINNEEFEVSVDIPVTEAGAGSSAEYLCRLITSRTGFSRDAGSYTVTDGYLHIKMPPQSGAAFCSDALKNDSY
ncbi:MAG: glycoside hydrolase family 13 protein [Lachnospiraceae bacterium]|nr:glycoside hydrolase family 13 protein [Lachnospiraceae bacterium]